MIAKQEILEFAQIAGLRPDIIEKDYVLGWLLAGIRATKPETAHWIFKGGTCLKKCYFETYRFSEDLDFTLTANSPVTLESLSDVLKKAGKWVYQASGIQVPEDSVKIDINPKGKNSFEGKIGYVGPLSRAGSIPKIKLDFSSDEILVLQPIERDVVHPYSDKESSAFKIASYAYEELFAEKIRALAERLRPRDLYDVIHLYRHRDLLPDKPTLLKTLGRKCEFKKIEVPTFQIIDAHTKKEELYAEWKNMLEHQLQMLPEPEVFWAELRPFFDWLTGKSPSETIPVYKSPSAGETEWIPKIDRSKPAFFGTIQKIQFAASNRVCVRLTYHGRTRTIEPLSFRQSRAGKVLFYGHEREAGHPKAFTINEIQNVELTQLPYQPKYRVEISAVGPISAPPISRSASNPGPFLTGLVRQSRFSSGPTYVYRCPNCDRLFKRKKMSPILKQHVDSDGRQCYGRYGNLEDTIY